MKHCWLQVFLCQSARNISNVSLLFHLVSLLCKQAHFYKKNVNLEINISPLQCLGEINMQDSECTIPLVLLGAIILKLTEESYIFWQLLPIKNQRLS